MLEPLVSYWTAWNEHEFDAVRTHLELAVTDDVGLERSAGLVGRPRRTEASRETPSHEQACVCIFDRIGDRSSSRATAVSVGSVSRRPHTDGRARHCHARPIIRAHRQSGWILRTPNPDRRRQSHPADAAPGADPLVMSSTRYRRPLREAASVPQRAAPYSGPSRTSEISFPGVSEPSRHPGTPASPPVRKCMPSGAQPR